jgi:hypothetical protein
MNDDVHYAPFAFLLALLLVAACGDNVITPLPSCAELGCRGLDGTCKPSSCACAPTRQDTPMACTPYPSCGELGCRGIACADGDPLCTCELADGSITTCED